MKRTLTRWLLGLIFLVSAAWSQDEKRGGETEKEVAALEQQWLQSQKANNPDLIAPLLAEKFINTGDDGKVTAIATGAFKARGTDPSGKPFDVRLRFTDTWVKMRNGQWQCVASHLSMVKM